VRKYRKQIDVEATDTLRFDRHRIDISIYSICRSITAVICYVQRSVTSRIYVTLRCVSALRAWRAVSQGPYAPPLSANSLIYYIYYNIRELAAW